MKVTDAAGICRAPIGVFDSGVGGLTVAREIIRNLPNERIVYFGDTARVPYGSKSKDTIIRFSRQIIRFLRTQNVKAIVIACNTASALALDEVERELDIPIIGVLKPGAKVAAETTKNGKIGVIGTESTINSGMYKKFICEQNPDIRVYGKACPLFVPLVEEGWLKDPVTEEVARRYLEDLLREEIDSLILGCTHYPLLRSLIRKIAGDSVNLVNPAYETARELGELLKTEGLENPGDPISRPAAEDRKKERFAGESSAAKDLTQERAVSKDMETECFAGENSGAKDLTQEKPVAKDRKEERFTGENPGAKDLTKGNPAKGSRPYPGQYRFFVSDAADKFCRFANSILPFEVETTGKINIEEY